MTQQEQAQGETMWERAERAAAEMRVAEQRPWNMRAPYGVAPADSPEAAERRVEAELARAKEEAWRERAARVAADEYAAEVRRSAREEASKQIWIGGLICIVGIVVTVVSYAMAAEGAGGGRYVVAWGAVIFGAIRLIRGIVGWAKASEPTPAK